MSCYSKTFNKHPSTWVPIKDPHFDFASYPYRPPQSKPSPGAAHPSWAKQDQSLCLQLTTDGDIYPLPEDSCFQRESMFTQKDLQSMKSCAV